MNLVGKIFVFLILLMSVCFSMLAVGVYMAHTNWRERVLLSRDEAKNGLKPLGLKYQLEDERAKTLLLQTKMEEQANKYKTEMAAKRQALIKAENANVLLAADNKKLTKDKIALMSVQEGKLAAVQAAQEELNALRKQVEILKQEVMVARTTIDEKFKQVVEQTEINHKLTLDTRNLQVRNDQLTTQVAHAARLLDLHGLKIDSALDRSEPVISGIVKGVRVVDRTIYVQLSIGSDDGLLIGHSLEIFRGATPLGRVVVIRTEPDKAVGRVEEAKGQIQVRDQVESRRSLKLTAG